MDTETFRIDLACDVDGWERWLLRPGYPFEDLGKMSLERSGKFRELAILDFLLTGSPNFFFHQLSLSGTVREWYLIRCREDGHPQDYHRASGRVAPLLDSIAAGDLDLAGRIAVLSPRDWKPEAEYEDDYCYGQILHHLVYSPRSLSNVQDLLFRFERCVSPESSHRLAVCRAVALVQQAAFDTAFGLALQEWEKVVGPYRAWDVQAFTALAEQTDEGNCSEVRALRVFLSEAASQVHVEALAWLCLAERAALRNGGPIPFLSDICPAPAAPRA